ncbi:hypothetical protein C0995_001444 [Termitomyces sp. Mi166|nr:hypothetical protein C0995_001444 [Termitomyces sp. Mi166\
MSRIQLIEVHCGRLDAQNAALLVQSVAAAGMSSHDLSPTIPYEFLLAQEGNSTSSGFNDLLFDHGNMAHTQLPPFSSLDFLWHPFPPQHQGQQAHPETHPDQLAQTQGNASAASSSSYPYGGTSLTPQNPNPPERPDRQSRRSSTNAAASVSASASISEPDSIQTELEGVTISDEKRRRNTEASARFRIKKKQRTLNLERTVSDLTGRIEDLEREAADLRRENGWLKEIVILKGSRLAGANLASHIMAESAQRVTEQDSSRKDNDSSDGDSSDAEEASTSKKKGKSRKK